MLIREGAESYVPEVLYLLFILDSFDLQLGILTLIKA